MNKTRKLNFDWGLITELMGFLYNTLCLFVGRHWKDAVFTVEDENSGLPPSTRMNIEGSDDYIIFVRKAMPSFESEEEESDFWDEHNLSEFYWEPADDIVLAIKPVEQNCGEATE